MASHSHVLVYHGPLQIATFSEWLAIYFHYGVDMLDMVVYTTNWIQNAAITAGKTLNYSTGIHTYKLSEVMLCETCTKSDE